MRVENRASFGWPATRARHATPTKGVCVHYDGSDRGLAAKPHSACRAYWKWCRTFHMGPARNWVDIGYSWFVCPHGIVLEGRGLNREQAAQPGGNTTWYSVTFGTGEREEPTAAALAAFAGLRAWLRGKGVGAGIRGHRDFYDTTCPGGKLYRLVTTGALAADVTDWMEAMVRKLPTLGLGDTGEDVQTVQGLLHARNHTGVKITGTFDAATKKAVQAVQTWGGVEPDGLVGPDTWPVLLRVHT